MTRDAVVVTAVVGVVAVVGDNVVVAVDVDEEDGIGDGGTTVCPLLGTTVAAALSTFGIADPAVVVKDVDPAVGTNADAAPPCMPPPCP